MAWLIGAAALLALAGAAAWAFVRARTRLRILSGE